MQRVILVVLALLLTACASNPKPQKGTNVKEFVTALKGLEYNFNMFPKIISESLDGSRHEKWGIVGLRSTFRPAAEHCAVDGGELVPSDKVYKSRRYLPQRIHCKKGEEELWEIRVEYKGVRVEHYPNMNNVSWYFVTLYPTYYPGNTRHNKYGDMEILKYCKEYPIKVYNDCRNFAQKAREEKAFEWQLFQSLNLPINKKKAREDSKKYNNTYLLTDNELNSFATSRVLPKYQQSLRSNRMNLNSYFCGAGINNYKMNLKLNDDKLYKECLNQLEFTKDKDNM